MEPMNLIRSLLFLLFFVGLSASVAGAEWPSYRTVIHVHSDVSSGEYSFDELASIARNYGVDAVFLTDNHWLGFQYGLPRLEQVAWVSKKLPSVLTYGPRRFLKEVAKTNRRQDEVLLIPGIEVIPRYYWAGSPLRGDLTNWNMQRNLMILGVDDPAFIRDLPVAAGYVDRRDSVSVFFSRLVVIWLALAFSLAAWWPKAKAYWRHRSLRMARGEFILLVLLPSALLVMLFNVFENGKAHDIYGRKVGVDAEQRVIDAAADRQYFCYWAHPEADDANRYGPVRIRSNPYPDMLRRTRNYTAFAALYEQDNQLYLAGHEWDQVLLDYIRGVRGYPSWALGEMLYHYEGHAGKKMPNVETVIWADHKTQPELLNSLKRGRFYSRRRSDKNALILNEFSINESKADTAWVKHEHGSVSLRIAVAAEQPMDESVTLTVVKNGEVLYESQVSPPELVTVNDKVDTGAELSYYRVYLRGAYPLQLVSNPLFVE